MPFGVGEKESPLDTALIRAAFPSAGASMLVPQLLQPQLFRTADLRTSTAGLNVAGEDKTGGKRAWRIEGTYLGQKIVLWIDQNEYLIVNVMREVAMGSFQEVVNVRYRPRLNQQIPPEALIFRTANRDPGNDIISVVPATLPSGPPVLAPKARSLGVSLRREPGDSAPRLRRPEAEDVVRVDTDLVVSAVLVVDPQGKMVRGLTKADFIVKEDDKLQEVESITLGDSKEVPRSMVLIIDYSGSQLPYIRTSIEAAKTLVDKLNPKDRMALVTDDVKLLVDFTTDKQMLKGQLDALKNQAISGKAGASEQYDALMSSLNELFDAEDIRPIVIFQTDGDQLGALKGGSEPNPFVPPRKYGLEDVFAAAERARATIYSIIPGLGFTGLSKEEAIRRAKIDWANREAATLELMRARNQTLPSPSATPLPEEFFVKHSERWMRMHRALMGLAEHTGAWAEFLERPDQADEIYTRVLSDIDRRYVIGYYPTNRNRDGKRRKVSIEVRGHPEYAVWGQKNYFARLDQ
jgi:VWFA-related protein